MNQSFSLQNKRIWVAGHRGMVGSAVVRRLAGEKCEVLTTSLDLRKQADVDEWLNQNKPDAVILAAARVGGIAANSAYPADFLYDNLMIEANVIHGAYRAGVNKLLFLGSSCIYPRDAAQPIVEEALLTGALEGTNEWYALAKIAGIKLCQAYRRQHGCDFIAAMPCNLYGPGDTYDAEKSHVIPALLMKMHAVAVNRESSVEIWGTGTPLREFLYVDDLADALIFMLTRYSADSHINIGSGAEISIANLAREIAAVTGYGGAITFNPARPDGAPRKVMDCSRIIAMGWKPQTRLTEGLRQAYAWYLQTLRAADAA